MLDATWTRDQAEPAQVFLQVISHSPGLGLVWLPRAGPATGVGEQARRGAALRDEDRTTRMRSSFVRARPGVP